MRHKPARRALRFDFLGRFAEGQRLGLGKDICQEDVVVASQGSERVAKRDKVTRDQPRALMNQLIERMLAVGAGFAPVDRPGLVIHFFPAEGDVLAVALHGQLLQIRGEALQVLFVGQNRHRLRAEKVVVPNRQQPHEHRQVLFKRRGAEMLIHLMKAGEHRPEIVRADRQHRRKTDG